jgi:hypothetical protein
MNKPGWDLVGESGPARAQIGYQDMMRVLSSRASICCHCGMVADTDECKSADRMEREPPYLVPTSVQIGND